MLILEIFEKKGKPANPNKNLPEQRKEPTTNLTHSRPEPEPRRWEASAITWLSTRNWIFSSTSIPLQWSKFRIENSESEFRIERASISITWKRGKFLKRTWFLSQVTLVSLAAVFRDVTQRSVTSRKTAAKETNRPTITRDGAMENETFYWDGLNEGCTCLTNYNFMSAAYHCVELPYLSDNLLLCFVLTPLSCLQRPRPLMYDMFKLHCVSTHLVRSSLRERNNRQH